MQGGGGEGVLPVLRVPDNAADAAPCEQILIFSKNLGPGAKTSEKKALLLPPRAGD